MEKINNKVLALAGIVIVIIAGASLALLSNKDNSNNNINPAQKEYTTIRMPNESSSTWVILATLTDEKGFFEEEGIRIEWTGKLGGGGPGQLASIAGGSNDAGSAAVSAIINAISRGVKIKAVAPEYELFDAKENGGYYVLENSSIRTAKDFVGKKFSVNTLKAAAEYQLREYLMQNNVPFEVELVIVDTAKLGNPYLNIELLKKGEIDIYSASGLLQWKLLQNGGVRLIPGTSNYEIWGRASGKPAYVLSEEFIKKNPDATRRFIAALAKGADYTIANPEEVRKIMLRYYPNIDNEAAKYIIPQRYPEHALISEKEVKLWIDRMVKYGDLKEGQIKPSDIYTNEFNPYYKK